MSHVVYTAHVQPISTGAQRLLQLLLDYVAADKRVPSQAGLAAILLVQRRTIERWVRELREASLVSTQARRRGIDLPIDLPIHTIGRSVDSSIGRSVDRSVDEHRSTDRMDRQIDRSPMQQTLESTDRMDRQMLHGGGGEHDHDLDSTKHQATKNRRTDVRIETETGRFLVNEGFSRLKAAQFQLHSLEHVKADMNRRRDMGQGIGAIVRAWEIVPPSSAGAASRSAGSFSSAYIGQLRSQLGYDEESSNG